MQLKSEIRHGVKNPLKDKRLLLSERLAVSSPEAALYMKLRMALQLKNIKEMIKIESLPSNSTKRV